ncbi:MAG: J domain-containing protein [Planctomycetota bacterium]|jgi:curved DNA-binding protein CbpA
MDEDFYKILGITENASSAEIHGAYRKLAKEYHPDKVTHLGPDLQQMAEQKMLLINKAYAILSNALKRKEYDTQQSKSAGTASSSGTAPPDAARQRSPAAKHAPSSRARDTMIIETHLYQLKEKIRKETKLSWSDFKLEGFSSAAKAKKSGLGKKEYVVYFKVEMLLEPHEFREFTHQTRALDSKDAPGLLASRTSIFVIAVRALDSPAKIESIFNIFNDEAAKGGKTIRYVIIMDATKNRIMFPREKPKDKLVRKLFEIIGGGK